MQISDSRSRVLAFDFGTGGLTVGLFNPHENRMEGFGGASYGNLAGLADPSWKEQDPRDWIAAIPVAMKELRKATTFEADSVVGIGIGGHMHALVVLGEDNQPALTDGKLLSGAIMWDDPRGEKEGRKLSKELGEPIAARMTASRIRWFAANHPEAWKKAVKRVCVPSTFVALEVTGEFGVGPGEGSGMFGQLDRKGQFGHAKLDKIDRELRKRAPKVGTAGEVLGRLNARGAELLGLPEGIPVAYPEGDQPIGMVASGCVDGRASISLGNSVVFNAVGNKPVLEKRGLVDSFRTADNRHLLMTCMTSGCVVYDELVDCFFECSRWSDKLRKIDRRDWQNKDDIRYWLTSEAAKVPAGCDGVLALPFYKGEGVFKQPTAFASFLGFRDRKRSASGEVTSDSAALKAGVLARASLEATSLTLRVGFSEMGLKSLDQIVVSGGGSRNTLWPQIIADVFGVPVAKPQNADEAATRGAAYLALLMARREAGDKIELAELLSQYVELTDRVEPNAENTKLYKKLLPKFEKSLGRLTPLYS